MKTAEAYTAYQEGYNDGWDDCGQADACNPLGIAFCVALLFFIGVFVGLGIAALIW